METALIGPLAEGLAARPGRCWGFKQGLCRIERPGSGQIALGAELLLNQKTLEGLESIRIFYDVVLVRKAK